jgi:hypothetical protein
MHLNFADNYMVKGKFSIKKASTEYSGKLEKSGGKKMLQAEKVKLRELQEKLYVYP